MIERAKLEKVIHAFIEESGDDRYFLVHLEVMDGNRISVEIDQDEEPIDLDTIVALTRYIEERFDREVEDYELQVSSAGLTSPLQSPRRFRKFLGRELEVLLRSGHKEVGILTEVDEEGILLEVTRMEKPEGARRKQAVAHQLRIMYDEIKRATYLIRF